MYCSATQLFARVSIIHGNRTHTTRCGGRHLGKHTYRGDGGGVGCGMRQYWEWQIAVTRIYVL